MKKAIMFIFFVFSFFVVVNGQETENGLINSNNLQELYFSSDYFYDTINLFGYKKDSMFYLQRKNDATRRNIYCSQKLSQLKEQVINVEYPNDVFRFTWFQSFARKHNPLTLRMEKMYDSTIIVVKYVQNKKNVKELISDSIFISNNCWDLFCATVDSLYFFDMQPIEKSDILVMDGSTWILEGKINNEYHMVYREEGENKDIGLICMKLVNYYNNGKIKFKL